MDDLSFNNTMDMKCGEVFLNPRGNLIMLCTLCEVKFKEFQEYSDHVLEKHLLFHAVDDDINIDNMDNTQDNFEMNVEFAPELDDVTTISLQTELEEEYKQLEDDSQYLMEEIEFLETIEPSLEDIEEYNVMLNSTETVKSIETEDCKASPNTEEDLTPTAVKHQIYKCFTNSSNEGSKGFYCEDCNKGFYSRSGYRSHIRSHNNDPKFQCRKECGQLFFNFKDFKKHMEKCKYASECEMQCNECSLIFHDSVIFRKHMDLHERPFKCRECSVSMKSARALERHMETHGMKQELVCELCSNGFGDQNSLLEHLRREHPGAPPIKVSIRHTKL